MATIAFNNVSILIMSIQMGPPSTSDIMGLQSSVTGT